MVARIRHLAGTRRVGHAGTLDPMATGVLVVGVEKATRLLGHLTLADKAYTGTIRLGQATSSDDAQGEIVSAAGAGHLADSEIARRRRGADRRDQPGAAPGERGEGGGRPGLPDGALGPRGSAAAARGHGAHVRDHGDSPCRQRSRRRRYRRDRCRRFSDLLERHLYPRTRAGPRRGARRRRAPHRAAPRQGGPLRRHERTHARRACRVLAPCCRWPTQPRPSSRAGT